jgi:hypothetical protein
MILFTGLIVPSHIRCMNVMETTLVLDDKQVFKLFKHQFTFIIDWDHLDHGVLFPATSMCHGTMLEWCSIVEMIISSPFWIFCLPQVSATRLIPSVVPPVKTICSRELCIE